MTHLLPMCPGGGPRQFGRRTQVIRPSHDVAEQSEMARRIGASFSRQSLDLSCSLLNLTRASRRASVPILGPGPGPSAPLLVSTNLQESVPQSSGTSMCSGQIRVAGQVGRGQVGVPGQVGRGQVRVLGQIARERSESRIGISCAFRCVSVLLGGCLSCMFRGLLRPGATMPRECASFHLRSFAP